MGQEYICDGNERKQVEFAAPKHSFYKQDSRTMLTEIHWSAIYANYFFSQEPVRNQAACQMVLWPCLLWQVCIMNMTGGLAEHGKINGYSSADDARRQTVQIPHENMLAEWKLTWTAIFVHMVVYSLVKGWHTSDKKEQWASFIPSFIYSHALTAWSLGHSLISS